jgi:hypothetical protein
MRWHFPIDQGAARTRRGMALGLALLLVVLVLAAGALSVSLLIGRQHALLREQRNLHLQALLDAGVALALARYSEDRFYSDSEELVLDGGVIHIEGNVGDLSRRFVELRARYAGAQREALVTLSVPPTGLPSLVDWSYTGAGPPRLIDVEYGERP